MTGINRTKVELKFYGGSDTNSATMYQSYQSGIEINDTPFFLDVDVGINRTKVELKWVKGTAWGSGVAAGINRTKVELKLNPGSVDLSSTPEVSIVPKWN